MHIYHGLIAIHHALKSNPVLSNKLKTTWFKHKNAVNRKHHQKFKKMSNIVSYSSNYRRVINQVDHFQHSSLPVLPHYWVFQNDYQHYCPLKSAQIFVIQYLKINNIKYFLWELVDWHLTYLFIIIETIAADHMINNHRIYN